MAAFSQVCRGFAGAALLALVAMQPFSGRPALAQDAQGVIRVGVGPDEATTPILYTSQAEIYEKYGLTVEVVRLRDDAAVAAALAGGSLEIGKMSALALVIAVANGSPFTAIGSISYYNSAKPAHALLAGTDLPYDAIGKHFSDFVMFADAKWAGTHRAILDRFLRATDEGSQYIAAHESEGTAIIAKFNDADPSTIANTRKPGRGVALGAGDLQPLIEAAAKYKLIPQSIPAKTMICPCALPH